MAEKKNKWGLIIGVIGVAGLIGYEWWKKNQAAMTTTTTTTTTTLQALPTDNNPVASVQPMDSQVLGQQAAQQGTAPNGIDPTVYATVQKWATGDGRAPILTMAAAAVPSEYQGMYNIIVNYWDAGVNPTGTPAETFWDDLRSKYDPSHLTW